MVYNSPGVPMGLCNAFKMGARLVILEAELLQFGLERNQAAQGLEQQGMRMGQMEQQLSSKAEALQ